VRVASAQVVAAVQEPVNLVQLHVRNEICRSMAADPARRRLRHPPARSTARTDPTVRRAYDRAQFERAWLAYVPRDAAHPRPARPAGVRAW
jgi:hypothetical protein